MTCTSPSEGEALQSLVNDLKITPVKQFINNAYPVAGNVIAVESGDGNKAKTVYIDLGKNDGVSKGQSFAVFKEVEIAGELSKKEIGEIQIQEIMSATRSLCKVKKGAGEIQAELNAGHKLPIETKEQKSNFFKSIMEE